MSIKLPLFPLNLVFFPRMLLPLHIFEERYKAMIHYCLEGSRPFGIVLIRSGQEVGGPAEPYEIGTKATILRATSLEEGRKTIIVRGSERFIIREILSHDPFLIGRVEDYPLETGGMDSNLLGHTELAFFRYLRLLKELQGITVNISNSPDDPEGIAWMIAWGMQVAMQTKQELLSCRALQDLLVKQKEVLENENRILSILGSEELRQRTPPDQIGYLSLN